jgi:hypothetical protein
MSCVAGVWVAVAANNSSVYKASLRRNRIHAVVHCVFFFCYTAIPYCSMHVHRTSSMQLQLTSGCSDSDLILLMLILCATAFASLDDGKVSSDHYSDAVV